MATNYITVKGYIRNGKIEVDLPENVTDGEVELFVPVESHAQLTADMDNSPLTDEEIENMINPNPKSGAEIVALGHTGGWENKGITDSVEWVAEQRRKRREKRGW
jgi:hypothetical protein